MRVRWPLIEMAARDGTTGWRSAWSKKADEDHLNSTLSLQTTSVEVRQLDDPTATAYRITCGSIAQDRLRWKVTRVSCSRRDVHVRLFQPFSLRNLGREPSDAPFRFARHFWDFLSLFGTANYAWISYSREDTIIINTSHRPYTDPQSGHLLVARRDN
jgi:hypothetical protein